MSEPQKIASQTETTQEPGSRILAMLDVMLDMRFPDDITISPDGKRVAFVVWERVPDEPKRRGRIWVADTSGGEARPLTKGKCLNPIAEETLALSATERISYESVDGWRIDGLFTPPITQRGDGPPPLYVDVHGGPSGVECDFFDGFTQWFASAGYAVFKPNMRGSWGHGTAFADAVLGDMGGKDFQDILNGVEYLVNQGRVDGNRVAIGGWSNGGYLTAWAITQTNRFKAAMMGAGISDWHNMHAQTNIADADVLLLAADPLENPEVYRKHSPITYAGRVTTPTLILHGEDDPAVPVAQAYAFYRALRERNVPVELVVYPREGHGLNERSHQRDALGRHLRWLERYLQ